MGLCVSSIFSGIAVTPEAGGEAIKQLARGGRYVN